MIFFFFFYDCKTLRGVTRLPFICWTPYLELKIRCKDIIERWIKRAGEAWKIKTCVWICIFIFGPWSVRKTMETLAPLWLFSPVPYKDTNFPLRPSQRWHGVKLEHPWVSLNQTDRKWSSESPHPHSDSHEFPQFQWPVGWLLIQGCATVLPLNTAIKGQKGGSQNVMKETKNNHISFTVTTWPR